MWTSLAEHRGK